MTRRARGEGAAPTLRLFVDDPGLIGPEHTDAMVREVRALLAVARAAGPFGGPAAPAAHPEMTPPVAHEDWEP